MATVKNLQRRTPLQQAAGGGALSGVARVELLGEGFDAAAAVAQRVTELMARRAEYEALRDAFATGDAAARGLAASKAILLLRPPREAIAKAAAQGAAAQAHRGRRHGSGR